MCIGNVLRAAGTRDGSDDAPPDSNAQGFQDASPLGVLHPVRRVLDEIVTLLRQKELATNVLFSFGQFLDVLPARASKGQALRYVAQRLDIPMEHILAAGGSGADEDMMRGNTLAVVVGNRHHEELSQLVDQDSIYRAVQPHALGILEAIDHYDFFQACRMPEA